MQRRAPFQLLLCDVDERGFDALLTRRFGTSLEGKVMAAAWRKWLRARPTG